MTSSRLPAAGRHTEGKLKGLILLGFLFVLGLVAPVFAGSPPGASGLADAQARAAAEGLADARYWQILLHYKPNLLGRTLSLIDDPRFFLAEQGKTDPAAELAATLAALWQPQSLEQPEAHVRCRFPARSSWLLESLAIDVARLPPVSCAELDLALEKVDPRSAVLIFPGNHNNSPASMFGHTLIGIEGPYQSRLLAYAANYAARTDDSNSVLFAIKGMFGLYPGFYSLLPYYVKVREYNDLERRDVWEYRLNLTRDETLRMTRHLWELRDIASDYYFFDENCSYNLLFLLEAARPRLNLTDPCRPWVIPIDTVRVVSAAGLVEEVVYRPSKTTRIQHLARQMTADEEAVALELLAEQRSAESVRQSELPLEARMRILDVASEMLEFRYYRQEFDQATYRRKSLGLLRVRSQLGRADDDYLAIADPGRPDHGHGSNRLALGFGLWDDDWYQELRLRPAYHNLLDADPGYLPGSQIDFTNLVLRVFPERHQLQLQALDLINIVSLSPRNAFDRPISWKVATGFTQHLFDDADDHLVYQLNPGGGLTWGSQRAMLYGFAETDLLVGGRFRESYALGPGGTLGLLATPLPDWKLHASVRQIWYVAGEDHRNLKAALQQNWALGENLSLVLEVGRQRSFGRYVTDSSLLLNVYW